jgi:hypothetical protein
MGLFGGWVFLVFRLGLNFKKGEKRRSDESGNEGHHHQHGE